MTYKPQELEPEVLEFWDKEQIYDKLVKRNEGKKRFYYLDGPPYTTGRIHVGHAWGKAMRDALCRYKRMKGFNVWDRPGFDMHGLPIEVKVEKEMGVKDKQEIEEKIGMQKFVERCEEYAVENLWPMVKDFKRLGVWLNWKDPYMTIKNEYIEGAWWALAKAHENGYLYLGKKSMAWCPAGATALAKHELEYQNVTDTSIFVKFPIQKKEKEYLIVWTTTPWTIPLNLAVMAHPDFEYVKIQLENGEKWIVAGELTSFVKDAGHEFEIVEKFKGKDLEGLRYVHPYAEELEYQKEIENSENKAHTVVLSKRYVTLDQGSGLVHCAPGCGPEDNEVGNENNLTPYNNLQEDGRFPKNTPKIGGLHAIKDTKEFIQILEDKGLLVAKTKIDHEYPHDWRYKEPIVYRSTNQWFLATEKLRDEMREQNKKVKWIPDWAGHKWFDSWLSGLQDWCISRQRFWGIPLPIWKSEDGDYFLVSSSEELEKLSGKKLENLHRPWIDNVIIEKDGKKYKRVPDVLDVWLDSGVAPWATLGYPGNKELFEELGFPDLILEAKDQIRGWYNSLMCMSMISFGKVPYKAVYMHGHINDALGRKMSKSLGNTISPYEVIDNYGADTLRFYTIGAANAGLDCNYNHDDAKIKLRNLTVFWNLQKLLTELHKEVGKDPAYPVKKDLEEKYILSKLNNAKKQVITYMDNYEIEKVPTVIEDLFLALSRDYIQITRDKTDKKTVRDTIYTVYMDTLKIFAPIAPFITEKIWQNLKKEFKLKEESIHLTEFPNYEEKEMNDELEKDYTLAKQVVQATLYAREKAKLSIRWPIKETFVVISEEELPRAERMKEVIKTQTNVKELKIGTEFSEVKEKIEMNKSTMGKTFGKDAPTIEEKITDEEKQKLKTGSITIKIGEDKFKVTKEHVMVKREIPANYEMSEFPKGQLYLNTERTEELDAEGYMREITRRVQALRKDAGLKKQDSIELKIQVSDKLKEMLKEWEEQIAEKCGAKLEITTEDIGELEHTAKEEVKGEQFKITFKQ